MQFDAAHYLQICTQGYSYLSFDRSNIAFFPAFPVASRMLWYVTGSTPEFALLATVNIFTLLTFVTFAAYSRVRNRPCDGEAKLDCDATSATAYAMCYLAFMPLSVFLRLPYSESCFLFFALFAFYAMACDWHWGIVAMIASFCVASRPVGIAILLPLVMYSWRKSDGPFRILEVTGSVAVSLLGLGGFMLFQFYEFGSPFCFIQTQEHWRIRELSPMGKAYSLLTFEPIWATYVPGTSYYWGGEDIFVSLSFWNPIVFVGTFLLLVFGKKRRLLNHREVAFGIGVLAIPYLTKSYEWGMLSHARFSLVAFPAWTIAGQLLSRVSTESSVATIGLMTALLIAFAALFVNGLGIF
jgi:hypothetical protein